MLGVQMVIFHIILRDIECRSFRVDYNQYDGTVNFDVLENFKEEQCNINHNDFSNLKNAKNLV